MKNLINPFIYDKIINNGLATPTIVDYITPTYSQCYEDIIIESILRSWMRKNNKQFSDYCYVEVGGNHPVSCSTSYYLDEKYGMKGIIVEAIPKLAANLSKARPNATVIECAVYPGPETEIPFNVNTLNEVSSASKEFTKSWEKQNGFVQEVISVKTKSINDILSKAAQDIAMLSIDLEGIDYEVLVDIDFTTHRPVVVQVEASDGFIPGNSTRMIALMNAVGYTLYAETDVNLIFVRN